MPHLNALALPTCSTLQELLMFNQEFSGEEGQALFCAVPCRAAIAVLGLTSVVHVNTLQQARSLPVA